MINFVRNTQTTGTSVSTVNVTVTAAGTGNLLVVTLKTTVAVTSVSVTDNKGNTYALATTQNNATNNIGQYYGVQLVGGATTITVSWTGVATARISVDEFSGTAKSNAAVYDVSATPATGTTGTSTSVSISPTKDGNLVLASASLSSGTSPVASSGYTFANSTASNNSQYKTSATTSETVSLSWTTTSGFTMLASSFNADNGAGNFFMVM